MDDNFLQDPNLNEEIGQEMMVNNPAGRQPGQQLDSYGDEIDDDEDLEDEDSQRLQAEETVLNNHLECVKQEAYLITVEGEIITKLENAMLNVEQYDMEGYLNSAEDIARKKLEMYTELLNNINNFKKQYGGNR